MSDFQTLSFSIFPFLLLYQISVHISTFCCFSFFNKRIPTVLPVAVFIICDLVPGLGCLSQVLSSNQQFSSSLTHLDLSGNPGSLVTEDATVHSAFSICKISCFQRNGRDVGHVWMCQEQVVLTNWETEGEKWETTKTPEIRRYKPSAGERKKLSYNNSFPDLHQFEQQRENQCWRKLNKVR